MALFWTLGWARCCSAVLWTILRGCFFASNKESCSDRERHRGRYKYTLQEVLKAELRQRMQEVLQQRLL